VPVESLRTKIEKALEHLVVHRRSADFQRLAYHVAALQWPGLCATTLVSDLGADALIPGPDGRTELVLACGIDGDLTKFKEDCRRLKQTHPELKAIVFATARAVTEKSKSQWRIEIQRQFNLQLREVIQREWITSRLEMPQNRWLCRDYLHIALTSFEDLASTLPRVRAAAEKLLETWKHKQQFETHLLIDLPLEEQPARTLGSASEMHLSDLPRRLRAGDRCWMTGVPGSGKTFSLIAIGSALSGPDTLIPIPVSLRELSQRRDKLLSWIASEPSFQEQGISEPVLANAASAGKLLFLLNGWNEIARDDRLATTTAVTSFIRQLPGSAMLIASRQPPGREFEFSARQFRIKPLSGVEIRKALRQSAIQDADRHADFILASGPLVAMAMVPLFLHAIIEELKAGSELPHGRQAMLRRMAERAVEEHRSAIEHGEVKEHAVRYLRDLAWEMTRLGRTTLPAEEACRRVAGTIGELQQEALLGERPPPPDILKQLCAGHLLISTLENGVAFTHQLIQEHFAATEITSVLGAAVSGRHAAAALPREILTEYQWEQPLFLALEDLAEQNRVSEITLLLDWFRLVDFEAACRMCAVVSSFWPTVRNLFQPVIRHLASLEDVNARWLAARCAAATGQPEFEDIVWVALAGHPEGNLDCFEGMSSTFILGVLGGQFTEKLLQVASEDFRFEALLAIGLAPSSDSLEVAECLAIQDSASAVRCLAYHQLFLSGRGGWVQPFLREAKQGGRPFNVLRLHSVLPRCTTTRLRKLLRWHFERNPAPEKRIKVLHLWNELDPSGASAMARNEYLQRTVGLPLPRGRSTGQHGRFSLEQTTGQGGGAAVLFPSNPAAWRPSSHHPGRLRRFASGGR